MFFKKEIQQRSTAGPARVGNNSVGCQPYGVRSIKSNRIPILLLFTFLYLASCRQKPATTQQATPAHWPALQTGDIVLRAGTGPYSNALAMLNARDKTWSHCGIVVVEEGYPFVYHSIGGEDNPDMRLKRDSVDVFFATRYCKGMGVARFNAGELDTIKLASAIHEYYNRHPLFDMQFDLATDDKLYCSEFIYKVIIRTTANTMLIPTSQTQGKRYVGIDDLYLNPHARLVWKALL